MDDEIAIVGVGCKFPGADNADEYWRVLSNAENHVLDIPKDRWNNDAFYDEHLKTVGKLYVRKAGLLKSHDEWDNRLFGISDNEASRVDPQQRYVLECVHMAMEDGGITRQRLNGSRTGVYMGSMNDDYKVLSDDETTEMTSYSATGISTTLIAARVSYVFNLNGPCLVLDTACSSSLVAIHLACQAIRSGDCDMAICGGVSSILNPNTYFALCKNKMMSPTGQCHTFCDSADGYARGEGCGVVIIQSVKSAVRDGNRIWATVYTGTNQDGHNTQPITAPSGEMQGQLLDIVYSRCNIDPCDVQYIEAHGTGTPIGDPTETNALGKFFSAKRKGKGISEPLLIGSVKSNIGHTESAAGVAGLIKILLMMKHDTVVPSLHVKRDKSNVNKMILFEKYGLDIALKVSNWPLDKNNTRVACLNSFGFGGSNCHAVIKQVKMERKAKLENNTDLKIVCISARDEMSLKLSLEGFERDINHSKSDISDICSTSCFRRDHFTNRIALVGRTKEEFQQACKLRLSKINQKKLQGGRNIVFVYCGVGTTWTGMCREMMSKVDVFRETVERIDEYLFPLCGWRIGDKFMENTNYDDPFLNHIAICSTQLALTEVWRRWGIQPDAVVGQSVGEVAAAYGSGHLCLQDAVKVIYHRSKILADQTGGAMMVVMNLEVSKVELLCKRHQLVGVCVAVYSSPTACTISGNEKEIDSIKADLEKPILENGQKPKADNRPIFIKKLNVQCAYHSPQLDSCRDEIIKQIGCFSESFNIPVQHISTVTGDVATNADFTTGEYWADNVRKPVLFMQGIQKAIKENTQNIFIEIGPRPVLRAHLSNILPKGVEGLTLHSLNTNTELQSMFSTLSELYEMGNEVNWNAIYKETQTLTDIPKYVFNKQKSLYLVERVKAYLTGANDDNVRSHKFIKRSTPSQGQPQFQLMIDPMSTPFVYDHFLSGVVLVPGATYVEMGFHIGGEYLKTPIHNLMVSVEFESPFTPSAGNEYTIEVSAIVGKDGGILFKAIHNTRVLSTGEVRLRTIPERPALNIDTLRERLTNKKDKAECYACLQKLDFQYGKHLNLIERSWSSDRECLVEILVPESVANEFPETHVHPAVIDALFQTFGIFMESTTGNAMPKGADAIVFDRPPQRQMYGYARQMYKSESESGYNAVLLTPKGSVILEVNDFHTRTVLPSEHRNSREYELEWVDLAIDAKENVSEECRILVILFQGKNQWMEELRTILHVDFVNLTREDIITATQGRQYTSILFYVAQNTYHIEDGNRLLDLAMKQFLALKELLNILSKRQISTTVYVVTECTQYIPDRNPNSLNLNGSALWGMIRSAELEGIYSEIRLLDVDPHNLDLKLLGTIVTEGIIASTELCLCGSRVSVPKISFRNKSVPTTRLLKMDKTCNANLVSESPCEVLNPFFRIPKAGLDVSLWSENQLRVRLKSFVKHDRSIYLPTTEVPPSCGIWPEMDKNSGYQVVAIEGRGTMLDGQSKKKREIVFCCPVNAATTVNVPKECVINSDSCMPYIPGTLAVGNILYTMIMEVPNKSAVVVVGLSKENGFGYQLCSKWLEGKGCRSKFASLSCLENEDHCKLVNDEAIALVVTYVSKQHLQNIVQRYPSLRKIVSLNNLITEDLKSSTKYNYKQIEITTFVTSSLFSPNSLAKSIPNVAAMVKRIRKEPRQTDAVEIVGSQNCIFDLPFEEINIESAISENSISLQVDKNSLFQKEACYVLIGGLNGLGWELLQLLASIGAGYIATISRSNPTVGRKNEMENIMLKHQCTIMSVQADIADSDSLEKGLKIITANLKDAPIKGIFHGAGVLADAFLLNQTEEKIKKVFLPKIQGAWNLHIKSMGFPLDFFVLHSSIVSVMGNAGQSNYAAGNSFMDSLAYYRRSIGLPAQTIDWGALSVGMAVKNDGIEAHLRKKGFSLLTIEEIKKCFVEALLINDTQLLCADIDWKVFTEMLKKPTQRAKYDMLIQPALQQTTDESENRIRFMFSDKDGKAMKEKLTEFVKTTICEVIVVNKELLNESTSLVSLGIDSMAAMSFSNTIEGALKCKIPFVILMSGETNLSIIVDFLADNIKPGETDDATEGQHDGGILEANIPFMQVQVLKDYLQNKNDPSMVTMVDLEINELIQYDDWVIILGHVIKMNPELRKKFNLNVAKPEDVEVKLVSAADIHLDLEKITFQTITKDETISIINGKLTIAFDLENDLPIRFQIAFDLNRTILRMILHRIVADIASVYIIFNDIHMTANAFLSKQALPPLRSHVNIPALLSNKLKPQLSTLCSFWQQHMTGTISPVTVGRTLAPIRREHCLATVVEMPNDLVEQMSTYIRKRQISVFHFVTSMYQLYLHLVTKQNSVPVTTSVDMRFHIPDLNGIVARCNNTVPMVSRMQKEMTLRNFLLENAETMLNVTQHSAYPYSLILNEVKSQILKDNLDRHNIIMNDMSTLNNLLQQSQSHQARLTKITSFTRTRYETCLRVQHDIKSNKVTFEFGFNSEICEPDHGYSIPNRLMELMLLYIQKDSITIHELANDVHERWNMKNVDSYTDQPRENEDNILSAATVNVTSRPMSTNNVSHQGQALPIAVGGRTKEDKPDKQHNQNEHQHNGDDLLEQVRRLMMHISMFSPTQGWDSGHTSGIRHHRRHRGYFLKQTSKGWDHRVHVSLHAHHNNSQRMVLKWGKLEHGKKRILEMCHVKKIEIRQINKLFALMLKTEQRWIVLKTPDSRQVEEWITTLQRTGLFASKLDST